MKSRILRDIPFKPMKPLLYALFVLILAACSKEPVPAPADLRGQVEQAITQDRFEDALALLAPVDSTSAERTELLYATHLTYGLFIMNNQSAGQMGKTMPQALRHLRRALELNPASEDARANIALIEGIYNQMGRPIPEGSARP